MQHYTPSPVVNLLIEAHRDAANPASVAHAALRLRELAQGAGLPRPPDAEWIAALEDLVRVARNGMPYQGSPAWPADVVRDDYARGR